MSNEQLQPTELGTETVTAYKEKPAFSPEQLEEIAKMMAEKEKQDLIAKEVADAKKVQDTHLEQLQMASRPIGEKYMNDLEDTELTKEERDRVEALKDSINIRDTRAISDYGVGIQQRLGGFSDKLLDNVSTKDTGEVGELLDDLLGELNTVDAKDLNKKPNFFTKLFRKASQKTSELLSQYQSVSVKVEKTANRLREIQKGLQTDIQVLTDMAEQNRMYGKAVKLYIVAGEEKLEELRKDALPEAQKRAESGDMDDQQALQRLINDINRLEKRVFDLHTSKTITLQTEPQIDMIRNTSLVLVEKINSSITTVIPLWKNQLTIALTLRNQANGAKAQESINNATNELLKKNASMLKMNTIEVAKQAEKGIVDIETLEFTQKELVETIQETLKIQKEGSISRQKAKERMVEMEKELRQQLLDLSVEAGNDYSTPKTNIVGNSTPSNSTDYLNM